jgi:hypothetical protein
MVKYLGNLQVRKSKRYAITIKTELRKTGFGEQG